MYFQPFIDAAGLHIPTYTDVRDSLVDAARGIFGQDIYLENDSQDYEFISIMAVRIFDAFLTLQTVYNNRGPVSAIGEALVGIVKLNGIKPKAATRGTCTVTLTGEPGVIITNGVVGDANNVSWDLPTTITFPIGGTIDVLATCRQYGPVFAGAGQLSRIVTPTQGWYSVTNAEAAVMGQDAEGQEALRARQTISTAKPSRTVLEGTIGGIAEIPDVTRQRVYENDTDVFGFYGPPIPGHSICAVVEGGEDHEIAREIYLRKTPGCGTYGDVTVEIPAGVVKGELWVVPVNFYRPSYIDVHAVVEIKPLNGYVDALSGMIARNVSLYINALQIGEDLILSTLWGIALAVMPDFTVPAYSVVSVEIGSAPGVLSAADMTVPFNSVARSEISNVKIVTV